MSEHNDPAELMAAAAQIVRSFDRRSQLERLLADIPAPDLYRITVSAADLASAMPQVLAQIADDLLGSVPVLDIYYPAGYPPENIGSAREWLSKASDAFNLAAQHLSFAQVALAHLSVANESRCPQEAVDAG